MLFQISRLLEERTAPICVAGQKPIHDALTLMIENNFSQLPVVDDHGKLVGIISEKTLTRSYYHLRGKISLLDMNVDQCTAPAVIVKQEDDLFVALDQLHKVAAVIVVDNDNKPIGIVTDYDTTHFFRDLYADLLRVEDIEVTLRQRTESAFPDEVSMTNALIAAFGSNQQDQSKPNKDYKTLTLGSHISMIKNPTNWSRFQGTFEPQGVFEELMHQVREIRNQLAHFREKLSIVQRDALMQAYYWMEARPKLEPVGLPIAQTVEVTEQDLLQNQTTESNSTTDTILEDSEEKNKWEDTKYDRFSRWLSQQATGDSPRIAVAFQDIERLIDDPLPPFASEHSSFWGNDSKSNPQSHSWLSAGWRVEGVDRATKIVTFRRDIAMQSFFDDLLARLKGKRPSSTLATKTSSDSWFSFSAGRVGYNFHWAFSREKLRVELIIETGDIERTRQAFLTLQAQKTDIEKYIGEPLIWEPNENRKLAKIFVAHLINRSGSLEELEEPKTWAVDTMVKFIDTFRPLIQLLP